VGGVSNSKALRMGRRAGAAAASQGEAAAVARKLRREGHFMGLIVYPGRPEGPARVCKFGGSVCGKLRF